MLSHVDDADLAVLEPLLGSTTACSRMSWGMRCAPGVRVPARFARFVSAVREHVRPLIRNRSIEGKGSADMNVPEEFGSLVFDDRAMKATLPAKVYRSLRKTIDEGTRLDLGVANAVAAAMKDWAVARGATHYTHWFQPLTGITAEKHDSFITPSPRRRRDHAVLRQRS